MKLKHEFTAGIFLMMISPALCQQIAYSEESFNETDRATMLKTNVELTEWHEKSFWSQYEEYREKMSNVIMKELVAVKVLADTDPTISDEEASANGASLLIRKMDDLTLKRQYYGEISQQHNGIVAFTFLQSEIIIDLLETQRVYDHTALQNWKFNGLSFPKEFRQQSKYNVLKKALTLSDQEASLLLPVFLRYENECEEKMGELYNLYSLFAGTANDFTPGLAKRQGHDLLALIERENGLKEKYFNEISIAVSPSIAARFLSWEDYNSVRHKLDAFAGK